MICYAYRFDRSLRIAVLCAESVAIVVPGAINRCSGRNYGVSPKCQTAVICVKITQFWTNGIIFRVILTQFGDIWGELCVILTQVVL